MMMKDSTPQTIYLKDYKKPDFSIDSIDLVFDLDDHKTLVKSKMIVKKASSTVKDLNLHGEKLKLTEIHLDGKKLEESNYELNDENLIIFSVPETFTLEIENQIDPKENKTLEGLYKSGDIFCTQNEPEGFRKITYFLDRSDVMTKYTTTIIADKNDYPILLSNGNRIDSGDLENNKHWVKWEDPFRKPSYLFALVAGNFDILKDKYTTKSGKEVNLEIYVDIGNKSRTSHAMESLKKAMKWDEDTFELEYDLDTYMIVAVDAFNMGAMENKGLNIFNSRLVLADPQTATDYIYHSIEGVIGHEYFHNWTGNRVTCRDWFQLTLKEGLTVYRDQEFSSDMQSRIVQRIDDVNALRERQFEEDAGPMSHPIRPNSFIEINNFYTSTVYEKGAEVIRMIHTIIGDQKFKLGLKKYFELYDGMAVTCEDFIHSMQLASGHDFSSFMNWYNQAGTPKVKVDWSYSFENKTFKLDLKQENKSYSEPLVIPLKFSLVDENGDDVDNTSKTLVLDKKSQSFEFKDVSGEVIPSINRNFSAPIIVEANYTDSQLAFLYSNDSDYFNRFEAGQKLGLKLILKQVTDGPWMDLYEDFKQAFKQNLVDEHLDLSFKELALKIPSQTFLIQQFEVIPFDRLHEVHKNLISELGKEYYEDFEKIYDSLNTPAQYNFTPLEVGRRRMKNLALMYMCQAGAQDAIKKAYLQTQNSNNMTDEIKALNILCDTDSELRFQAIDEFFKKWGHEKLVMNLWFQAQSFSYQTGTLEHIKKLTSKSVFDLKTPNCARSVLSLFARNYINFHRKDGESYRFMADKIIEIDKFNPSMASLLAGSFKNYNQLDVDRKKLCKMHLDRIIEDKKISKNTFEIVSNTLKH